jgi:hypothetical protein
MECPFGHSFKTEQGNKVAQVMEIHNDGIQATANEFVWPQTLDVTTHCYNADYEDILMNKDDFKSGGKQLCANGFVGEVQIEFFQGTNYTGLFQQGSIHSGVIRLSSALFIDQGSLPWYSKALSSAEIFPCVALKVPRPDMHSGNLLFAGKKTGQEDQLFFKNAVCTHLTEKVPLLLSWVQSLFSKYSSYPMQLGLSDFAAPIPPVSLSSAATEKSNSSLNEQQTEVKGAKDHVFPWCLALAAPHLHRPKQQQQPGGASTSCTKEGNDSGGGGGGDSSSDSTSGEGLGGRCDLWNVAFADISTIPVGTVLYDIFAFPDPAAALASTGTGAGTGAEEVLSLSSAQKGIPSNTTTLQRVGRITSTSQLTPSHADSKLFFKHQRKEEDYALRSEWTPVVAKHSATLGKIGSSYFQQLVERGAFVDLETDTTTK